MWASGSAASEPRAACLPAWPHFPGRKGNRPTYTIEAIPISHVFTVTPFRLLSPQKVSLSSGDLGWLLRSTEAWEGEVACSRSNGCLVTTGAEQPVALQLTHLLIVTLCAELFSYPSEGIGVFVINKPGRCLSQPCRRP